MLAATTFLKRCVSDAQVSIARRQITGCLLAASLPSWLSACGSSGGGSGSDAPVSSAFPWVDDIKAFAANIQSVHPDPQGITRGSEWQSLLAQIISGAGQKTSNANLVDCMRLAALMRDEHTRVNVSAGTFAQAAIRFATATDGCWVQQATAGNASLLGAQLLAIDGVPIAEVKERLKKIIPGATAAAYANMTPPLLHQSELLWLAGIATAATHTSYLLRDVTGMERTLTLQAGDNTALVSIYGREGGPVAPLWLSRPDQIYFSTTLADSQAVYVRYAQCREDPTKPLAGFFDEVVQTLSGMAAPRLVFDLRNNAGGNSGLLSNVLRQHAGSIPPNLKLAILINSGVYSSATINLYDLRAFPGARTFGEPPGTAPNHTGEVRSFTLARSGTQHTSSSRTFTLDPSLGANNYTPDVLAGPSINDRASGRDPVLARAEHFLRTGE